MQERREREENIVEKSSKTHKSVDTPTYLLLLFAVFSTNIKVIQIIKWIVLIIATKIPKLYLAFST